MAKVLKGPELIGKFEGIPIYLTYKTVKKIHLTFKPDRINISSFPGITPQEILNNIEINKEYYHKFLIKIKKIEEKRSFHINTDVSSYKKVLLFGKEYPIVYRKEIDSIRLGKEDIFIPEKFKSLDYKEYIASLDEFIKVQLEKYIKERLNYWKQITGLSCSKFTIRKMKTIWGSCTIKTATMRFNFYLAMFSKRIIDSVIIHELCHLKVANHQKEYYKLLNSYNPNYKEDRSYLNSHFLPIKYIL